jgi:acetyl esterase/lipase
MTRLVLIISFCVLHLVAYAQEFVPLWPDNRKPFSKGVPVTDTLYNERIWRVANPGLYCFPAAAGDNKGAAVLICPGGGYERISHIYNGFNLAKWYNTIGINAFVLIYRLPHQSDLSNRQQALVADAQRGVKWIRANASRFLLDTGRIGMMGTSAGGHLAAITTTEVEDLSRIGDSMDAVSWKPSFLVLLSPVISLDQFAHPGSRKNFLGTNPDRELIRKYSAQNRVRAGLPPTFIVHAQNDSTVNVRNSVYFHSALIEKNVQASLHVFPQGGHGIRIDDNPGSTDLWLDLLEKWLKELKFITPMPFK